MKFLHLSILIASCVICSTATGQDSKSEIDRYVFDPCMRVSVIYQEIDEVMDIESAMNFMKTMTTDAIESLYRTSIQVVTGKDIKIRKQAYSFGLQKCIEGGIGLK